MIELVDIHKSYTEKGMHTVAVNGVTLTVAQGEFVAIGGRSGCGKTTLLNIVGALDKVDHGLYKFEGKDVTTFSRKRLTQFRKGVMGYVFQSFNLLPELTALENVALPLGLAGVKRREREALATTALERVEMSHRLRHVPGRLSGGEQQRVAIARAIVHNPKLILADEPTGNLDEQTGESVMQLLTSLNKGGTTIMMVTHDPQILAYASKIVQMRDGKNL